ncbi:TPA: hypothetical protein IAC10_08095 [Candidatus Scatousia excrementigallinarum]|uniref:Uncharacterized protein n=1 Tax=Candidatus Scatousia excrementigallinarum TaxID=2840935 RepID=A0A9D1JNI6_9BACT|nr:hypothetical protein [Candidatus Scatousia excrementigallinarum]
MQINNSTPKTTYTPNFQSIKTFRLPTREVLECTVGKYSQKTLSEPSGLLKVFSKLYDLTKNDLKDLNKSPLGFNIYTLSSGIIIKANNPDIAMMSKNIQNLPKTLQLEKINNITQKIGSNINVSIDDSIKSYKMVNGEIVTTKVK